MDRVVFIMSVLPDLCVVSGGITSRPKKACMACRSSLKESLMSLRSVEFPIPTSE